MFSKRDLERLENKASAFVSECRPNYRVIKVFYRNKPQNYFTDIKRYHRNIMTPLLKDNNGDPKCPSNGKIKGLFFMGKNNKKTSDGLPDASPFGEKRVTVPAGVILNDNSNLYFSDFWCHKVEHYVSLVITRPGSSADRFCKNNLLQLDLSSNKYLRVIYGQVMMLHGYTFWIEVFYTESIDLNSPGIEFSTVGIIGRGQTTPGGIRKNPSCTQCHISSIQTSAPTRSYENHTPRQPSYTRDYIPSQHDYSYSRQSTYQTQHQQEQNNGGGLFQNAVAAVGRAITSLWNMLTRN